LDAKFTDESSDPCGKFFEFCCIKISLKNDMEDADKPGYKFSQVNSRYGGIEQRWLIVYSEAIYKSEEKAFLKKIVEEKESAQKQLWHLENQKFSTQQEAMEALEKIEKVMKYHFCASEFV
jgi:transposase